MAGFTDEVRKEMVAGYDKTADQATRDAQVAELATRFDTGVANVRGVLAREGVYVAKVRKAKGETGFQKAEYVNFLRVMVGAREDQLKTLEKATKRDLQVLVEGFNALRDAAQEAQANG